MSETNTELLRYEAAKLQQESRLEMQRLLGDSPEGRAFLLDLRRAELTAEGIALFAPWMADKNTGKVPVGVALALLEVAKGIGCSPILLARSAYQVHGRIAFSAEAQIAIARSVGAIRSIDWTETKDGVICEAILPDGRKVSHSLTFAECAGFRSEAWKATPKLMIRYRSASYLLRLHTSVSLGLGQSAEEMRDVIDAEPVAERVSVGPAKTAAEKVADDPWFPPDVEEAPAEKAVERQADAPTTGRRRRGGGE